MKNRKTPLRSNDMTDEEKRPTDKQTKQQYIREEQNNRQKKTTDKMK